MTFIRVSMQSVAKKALLAGMLLGSFSLTPVAFADVKTGDEAPNFTLKGQDGKDYQLKDFRGKPVVLEWFNHGCPYVKKHYETNNMQDLQQRYKGKGIVWFTIISSAAGKQGHVDLKDATKHYQDHKMASHALLLDPTGATGKAYAAKTTPHMYVISGEGKLVYQGAIDDNPSAKKDTVKTAKPLLANAVDAQLAGKPIAEPATKPYGCAVKYPD